MQKLIKEIPRTFKACIITALILYIIVIIGCGLGQNWPFAGECALVGGFSIAILCAYVVWTASVIVREKSHMLSDDKEIAEEAATRTGRKIQMASLLRTFILAIFLVICVAVFHINVIAAIIGVSITVVSMAVVPLFVKTEPATETPENSEVEKQ